MIKNKKTGKTELNNNMHSEKWHLLFLSYSLYTNLHPPSYCKCLTLTKTFCWLFTQVILYSFQNLFLSWNIFLFSIQFVYCGCFGNIHLLQRIIQGWSTVPTRLYYSYNELRLRLLKAKQKIQITKEYKLQL